jgi:hypothetical protein
MTRSLAVLHCYKVRAYCLLIKSIFDSFVKQWLDVKFVEKNPS